MLVSLKVEYRASLAKLCIHLISFWGLQEISFFIFLCVDESSAKAKAKRVES
jgi:hypothetical protein